LHVDDERESLFRCETKVVERSAAGYRIAPSHLIFTEPVLQRAAERLAITSPLAVKSRAAALGAPTGANAYANVLKFELIQTQMAQK
jgi:hypothetical protein